MNDDSKEDLRKACREAFGRDVTDAELDLYGTRLERQLRVIECLRSWDDRLGHIEPATVSTLFR